jgi:hypothetical protein
MRNRLPTPWRRSTAPGSGHRLAPLLRFDPMKAANFVYNNPPKRLAKGLSRAKR